MKRISFSTLFVLLLVLILSACAISPVVPQAVFDVTATARAMPVPPLPTIAEPTVPPTATVEATAVPTVELPTVTPTATCTILGNINAQGAKTAFKPGDPPYKQVKLDKPGEKCFATMEQAVAAGFTPYRGK